MSKLIGDARIKAIQDIIKTMMDSCIPNKDLSTFKMLTKELKKLDFVPGDIDYSLSSRTFCDMFNEIIKHDAGNIMEFVLSEKSNYNIATFEKSNEYPLLSVAVMNNADECIVGLCFLQKMQI